MEKMQGQEVDVLDTFQEDTERYLVAYCEKYGVEDLRKAPPNTFESAVDYAGSRIFLKPKDKTFKYNRQTIIDCDNADIVNYILDYYIFICGVYNKEVNIQGFSKYIKISEQTMYNWLNGEYKTKIYLDKDGNVISDIQEWKLNKRGEYTEILSTAHLDLVKKLRKVNEHTLANIGIGDRNNTGVAMKLNTVFSWNSVTGHEPDKKIASRTPEEIAAGYGKLSENGTQFALPEVPE